MTKLEYENRGPWDKKEVTMEALTKQELAKIAASVANDIRDNIDERNYHRSSMNQVDEAIAKAFDDLSVELLWEGCGDGGA